MHISMDLAEYMDSASTCGLKSPNRKSCPLLSQHYEVVLLKLLTAAKKTPRFLSLTSTHSFPWHTVNTAPWTLGTGPELPTQAVHVLQMSYTAPKPSIPFTPG